MAFQEEMGYLGSKVQQDPLDLLAPQALTVGEPSTPGGARAPAHKWKALSWSMMALLEALTTVKQEVEPISCVCLGTQNIALLWHTKMMHTMNVQ